MRTLTAYYFSATGNTKRALTALCAELGKHDIQCTLLPIEKQEAPASIDSDMVCIAYPVHGFNAPTIAEKWVKSLPSTTQNKYFFVVKTGGEPLRINNASSLRIVRMMQKKGYRFGAEFHYIMPYNIIFRHKDDMVALMRETLLRKVQKDAEVVAKEQEVALDCPPKAKLVAGVVRIEHPAMPLIGKTFHVNKKKCIDCGMCMRNCPTHNISKVKGRYMFGNHCLGCMRCSFLCPKEAINIGILQAWKVNGKYDFEHAPKSANPNIIRYCHNSYLRYFGLKQPKKGKKEDK